MKNLKLKKLLTLLTVTLITTIAILPIKASAAWKQSDSGNWSYNEGNKSVSGWKSIDGKWYFFDSNAVMKTGWILDGSTWYYTTPSGEMKTGWINDGGKWYYTASSGAMQTGWLSNNGTWYYLSTSGDMKTGIVETNGKTYYLNESGAMKTGNITVNGVNYSFAANGEKINSTNTPAAQGSTVDKGTVSSGGSGGGSGSSSGDTKTPDTTYKSLYGNWVVGDYIDSNIPSSLDDKLIPLCEGQQFNIGSSKISSALKTVSNPKVTEKTLTASDFSKQYNDTLENIGISGDSIKKITITQSDKPSNSVDVLVSDDGNVYTLVKGALFNLEKQ